MRFVYSLFLTLSICLSGFAQKGHEINVKLKGYQEDVLYLAYHYGDKQYVKDTVYRQADDTFVFQGATPLESGTYMLILAPDNQTFEFLIDKNEQRFGLSLDQDNMLETVQLTNSSGENRLFFSYLRYLADMRKQAAVINNPGQQSLNEAERAQQMSALSTKVSVYQKKLITENPRSLTAAIIRASTPIEYPEYEGSDREKQIKAWRYAQKHFFDSIDLTDSRLIRSPLLHEKVTYFVDKLQAQHPDTISRAIDYVLAQMVSSDENYKYFVIHFLNKYARSKVIGMDAVYVHMVENYYTEGQAPWTAPDQLEKILTNAAELKPLLLGKRAPDIQLKNRAGLEFNLHSIKAEYTILYFWRFDCPQCKKTTPAMKELFDEFKDKGLQIVAICTKASDELKGCWDYADEQGLNDWVHASNLSGQSLASGPYHIRSTPFVYLLDKDKMIISKKLSPSQLADALKQEISKGL